MFHVKQKRGVTRNGAAKEQRYNDENVSRGTIS